MQKNRLNESSAHYLRHADRRQNMCYRATNDRNSTSQSIGKKKAKPQTAGSASSIPDKEFVSVQSARYTLSSTTPFSTLQS
jgi:hypothetical protein